MANLKLSEREQFTLIGDKTYQMDSIGIYYNKIKMVEMIQTIFLILKYL